MIKYKFKWWVSTINEHKMAFSLVLDGKEFHGLEAKERDEIQSSVVWHKSVIKFKG